MQDFMFLMTFFVLQVIILCVILYFIGKIRSDLEYFIALSEKQNEFIQDRLYVLEIKVDNFKNDDDDNNMLLNIASGKQ